MRSGTALALSLVAGILLAPAAAAKPHDGIPAWVEASERRAVAREFGHPTLVADFNIPYPRKIAVVLEFQQVVVCRLCSAPTNASLPHGRVVRISFDRATHRMTGTLRFCEASGVKPPLAACLAR